MKLNAFDIVLCVREGHDVVFFVLSGDLEAGRQAFSLDEPGMIASSDECLGDIGKELFIFVEDVDGCAFSVDDVLHVEEGAAKRLSDTLVAETDTEDALRWGVAFDQRGHDPGFFGDTWSR